MSLGKPVRALLRNLRSAGAPLFSWDESGSQIVEFALVLLPLFGFILLIIDIAWVCFAQESLQHAVQVGVRTAITTAGSGDQTANLKTIVEKNSMGFLSGPDGLNHITITCSPAGCPGGSIVQIQVSDVPVGLLGPIIDSPAASINLGAISSDIMENAPPPTS